MKKWSVFFKSFAAGRKELFKRIGVFCATALAVDQAVEYLLDIKPLANACELVVLSGVSLLDVLTQPLVYLGAGFLIALLAQGSFARYSRRFDDSDCRIAISMGDIFSNNGDIVIPSNNIFVSDPELIGSKSLHGQVVANSCPPKGSGITQTQYIDKLIKEKLDGDPKYRERYLLPDRTCTLAGTPYPCYEYGTVVGITANVGGHAHELLMLSMSELIEPKLPGVANIELLGYIDRMWDYIERYRIEGDTLVVPIMGTGAARAGIKKQVVARYILKSYAQRASQLGVRRMILSVSPDDFINDVVDLEELKTYADYLCRFPDKDFAIKE